MSWKQRRRQIHMALLLRQNRRLIAFVGGWFAFSYALFVVLGQDPVSAAQALLFFYEVPGTEPAAAWGRFYQTMSDFVIFGLVVSVVMVDMHRRYQPQEACRILAGQMEGHAIVVGYNRLGRRVVDLLEACEVPCVVVEEDRTLVADLVRDEHPLVLGSGEHEEDLLAANVKAARLVMVAGDDLETAAVVASRVRQSNERCTLVVRCRDDAIAEVLATRYRAEVVSVFRTAAEFIREYAGKHRVRTCLIVGGGQFGRRLLGVMKSLGASYHLVARTAEGVEDLLDDEPILLGDPSDRELLARAGVAAANLVVLAEEDLAHTLPVIDRIRRSNTSCRIVCRLFHDDASDMLEADPFRCDVLSTSQHTLADLVRKGAFESVGVNREGRRKPGRRTV